MLKRRTLHFSSPVLIIDSKSLCTMSATSIHKPNVAAKAAKKAKKQQEREKKLADGQERASQLAKLVQGTLTTVEGVNPQGTVNVIAFDIEAWDKGHEHITEIGWSEIALTVGEPFDLAHALAHAIRNSHVIVKEHASLINNTYCADRRQNFSKSLGASQTLPLTQGATLLQEALSRADLIVGHELSADIMYVEQRLGLSLAAGKPKMHWDTKIMNGIRVGDVNNSVKLEVLLDDLDVDNPHIMHNAGNDAHCTLLAFLRMVFPA